MKLSFWKRDFWTQEEKRKKPTLPKEKVKKQDRETGEFYYPVLPFEPSLYATSKQLKHDQKFYKQFKDTVVLIKMELANGMFREFLMNEQAGGFTYKEEQYVLDTTMKYYIIERDIWAYDFQEFVSLPFRRRFGLTAELTELLSSTELKKELEQEYKRGARKPINPRTNINEVLTLIENTQVVDVERSMNPITLKRFTDSEVIKQVLQGAMLNKVFKIMFVLIIVVAVIMLLLLIINVYSSEIIPKLIGKVRGG